MSDEDKLGAGAGLKSEAACCPHFDHHSPDQTGDELYALYEQLRDQPIGWSESYGGFWMVGRYPDVEKVLKDHETFCSREGAFLPRNPGFKSLILESDPPEHADFRRLVLPLAGRGAVKAAEPKLIALVERIVADFEAAGGGDAIPLIAERLPVEGIALMAGLPPRVASQLRQLTVTMWENLSTDPDAPKPLISLLMEEVEARRGSGGEDFLARLTEAEIDSEKLTEDQIARLIFGVVVAGHETTVNAASNLMCEMARKPALQARLRAEPELIPAAVEESLRHRAPVHLFFRTVTRDTELAGVEMREGDKVAVFYAAANRDPCQFADPDAFDVDRPLRPGHMSFGNGIHRCVGAPLAQVELRLLAQQLLRAGTLELTGEPIDGYLEGGHHAGWKELPLRIAPA